MFTLKDFGHGGAADCRMDQAFDEKPENFVSGAGHGSKLRLLVWIAFARHA